MSVNANSDINIKCIKPLIKPYVLINNTNKKINITLNDYIKINNLVYNTRNEINNLVNNSVNNTLNNTLNNHRFILIVGPCSIHDPMATIEYANKLKKLSDKVSDKILIVMRTYLEKPRTNVGWKGIINDPYLDNTFNMNEGLAIARELLLKINLIGLPVAIEYLDTISPQYLSDLISWGSIGARTVESQLHRQLASGLSCPIGFKNDTNGDIQSCINAIKAASSEHAFLGIDNSGMPKIINTKGNKNCHIILRGGKNLPNYYITDVIKTKKELSKDNNLSTKILIDCSHGNSQKQYKKQLDIINYYIDHDINNYRNCILGFMIESNLEEGNQQLIDNIANIANLKYGQSITDACIGWNDTELIITKLYKSLK